MQGWQTFQEQNPDGLDTCVVSFTFTRQRGGRNKLIFILYFVFNIKKDSINTVEPT